MKVLFLDVDGVLHLWPHNGNDLFHADKLELVKSIVSATGVKVVLSSNWRLGEDTFQHAKRALSRHGVELNEKTDYLHSKPRSDEILAWVANHPTVTEFAILDDMPDANVSGKFFRTDSTVGLTADIAEKVIHHLTHEKEKMKKKLRLMVVALPHTQTNKEHAACAYTQKVLNFCKMMTSLGHEVYHYGAEGSEVDCTEHIQIISRDEQRELIGSQDWTKEMYAIEWDERKPYWSLCNSRAVYEIKKRSQQRDFLCLIGGTCQKPIADALPAMQCVEYGIGYRGVFAPYRCYESYAHMHRIMGNQSQDPDGNFYHAVVPNYYDPLDFPAGSGDGNYFLYIGRLIKRKGIQIAVETCEKLGAKLLIAGQGVVSYEPGKLVTAEETYVGNHFEYVGFADTKRRAELMGRARAVFVPTLYCGPFEGVNVEAQLCGTPVITTDWGCFAETVEHGVSGYRCRTQEQFLWAANNVWKLDRQQIRERALRLYSLDKVASMFDEFFDHVGNLWEGGYYEPNPGRKEFDWLKR